MKSNVLTRENMAEEQLADLFGVLANPARLQILLAIGEGEACVCHLKPVLQARQPYISQQLMALRQAGLVDTRRIGRNIYYRLSNPALLDLIQQAAGYAAVNLAAQPLPDIPGCPLPECSNDY